MLVRPKLSFTFTAGRTAIDPTNEQGQNGNTHWWLANEEGEILDPTLQQIEKGFRYSEGKPRAFLTKRPSKRAKELIRRIERKR